MQISGVSLHEQGIFYSLVQILDSSVHAIHLLPGYVSFRNETGSTFLKTLCKQLQDNHEELDILTIMTRVANQVAYKFQTYNRKPAMNGKKQMPWFFSRLTKDVVFRDKDD